jgi:hypothetical protein
MLGCTRDSNHALNCRRDQSKSVFMSFTGQTMSIGELLANPFCVEAPCYQRSFSWEEPEAAKLLEDITSVPGLDAGASGAAYFLGAMLFIERDRPPASRLKAWQRASVRTLEVVDGLQRLTTLTILLCALRDLDAERTDPRVHTAIGTGSGPNARPRLSIGEPDEAFFLKYVRAPGATRLEPEHGDLSPARQRTLDVRDHLVTALSAYDAADRRKLADFLLDRCCVVQMVATDIDQAHRLFEVLNARGKPLARNDILKAELLGGVPEGARAAVKATWDAAALCAGADFEQLFSHIRAMYRLPDGKVISDIREIAAETGGAQAFVQRVLEPSAAAFDGIRSARHAGSPHSAAVCRFLRYLGWHSFSDWIPPAMLRWLAKGDDVEGLARFLAKLDRLAFAVRILGIGGSKRARRFGAVVTAIREGRDLDPADSPLELTRQELRTIQHNLRDLHERNAPAAKHLLMRLTEQKAGGAAFVLPPSEVTVEHVLPRKVGAQSQWRQWYPDPSERERSMESLGNLVLVTKAQNDRAGNQELARKLEVYFNTPGAPIPAINEDLRGRTQWLAADIGAREVELMRLIEELWGFDLARASEPSAPEPARSRGRRARRPKEAVS